MTIAVEGGYGKHFKDLEPAQRPIAGHRAVITSAVAIQTFGLPKIAIICLLERLLKLRLPVRIVLWGLSVVLIISSLVLSIFWFVQCSPQAHQWDPINVPGTCWSPNVVLSLSYFVGIYSGVLDVVLAVYPPFIIWNLKMSRGKKIFISASLGGGLVAAITVFYKTTTIKGLSAAAKDDPTCRTFRFFFIFFCESVYAICCSPRPSLLSLRSSLTSTPNSIRGTRSAFDLDHHRSKYSHNHRLPAHDRAMRTSFCQAGQGILVDQRTPRVQPSEQDGRLQNRSAQLSTLQELHQPVTKPAFRTGRSPSDF